MPEMTMTNNKRNQRNEDNTPHLKWLYLDRNTIKSHLHFHYLFCCQMHTNVTVCNSVIILKEGVILHFIVFSTTETISSMHAFFLLRFHISLGTITNLCLTRCWCKSISCRCRWVVMLWSFFIFYYDNKK